MKYLQSASVSKMYPFKVCVVARTRSRLWEILDQLSFNEGHSMFSMFLMGKEKRCGYVGFYYFKAVKEALNLRKKLYNRKDLYVFLQDDRVFL